MTKVTIDSQSKNTYKTQGNMRILSRVQGKKRKFNKVIGNMYPPLSDPHSQIKTMWSLHEILLNPVESTAQPKTRGIMRAHSYLPVMKHLAPTRMTSVLFGIQAVST